MSSADEDVLDQNDGNESVTFKHGYSKKEDKIHAEVLRIIPFFISLINFVNKETWSTVRCVDFSCSHTGKNYCFCHIQCKNTINPNHTIISKS
jgi:hypothetical protein